MSATRRTPATVTTSRLLNAMDDDEEQQRWRDNPYRPKDKTLSDVHQEISFLRIEFKQQLDKLNSQFSRLLWVMAIMFIAAMMLFAWAYRK
jgi:hypothetical protein